MCSEPDFLEWLYQSPWYVPAMLAAIIMAGVLWLNWRAQRRWLASSTPTSGVMFVHEYDGPNQGGKGGSGIPSGMRIDEYY